MKNKGSDEDIVYKNEVFSEYDEHAIVKPDHKHELKQEYEQWTCVGQKWIKVGLKMYSKHN